MFAPPPVQLSREQIERLKTEAQARAEAKRTSADSTGSGSPKTPTSLQRLDSRSPRRKNGLFTGRKPKVSSPIPVQESKDLSSPGSSHRENDATPEEHGKNDAASPVPFGEQPRKAPLPPKRPSRPASDLLPPIPGAYPSQPGPAAEPLEPERRAPPIPGKSPRRTNGVIKQPLPVQAGRKQSLFTQAALNDALAQLSMKDVALYGSEGKPTPSPRVSTAPATGDDSNVSGLMMTPVKANRATVNEDSLGGLPSKQIPSGKEEERLSLGFQVSKIDKSPGKRASAAAGLRAALLDSEALRAQTRRATEGAIMLPRGSTPPGELQMPEKRRRKGETMSMLLDAGFFPLKDGQLYSRDDPKSSIRVQVPPPLKFIDKDLPPTPDSIAPTPTEMYEMAPPRRPLPDVRVRKPHKTKRSPLGQLSMTNAKANSANRADEISPSRLSAIPELAGISENTPTPSGMTTPVATQIHLPGGSVVTVTPPELTAWQKHIYVQGPIKLPKPAIMPRKNSVASLEPFQEAIDQVYQDALAIPRRRSDDAVVDDVCDWFEDFGFDNISFEGDDLTTVEEIMLEDVRELDEDDVHRHERYSTPPPEPIASPIEKVVAKEVIDMTRATQPLPKPIIPPVENEETLRARGIARLSRNAAKNAAARKESLTLPNMEANKLSLAPLPEESMLAPATAAPRLITDEHIRATTQQTTVDHGGMDWEDVEELDETPPQWIAPAVSHKNHALDRGRNPVTKMRGLFATASTIL